MIDILMATYNGEAYLNEQLKSIENQTWKRWRLTVCDDGSRMGHGIFWNSFNGE